MEKPFRLCSELAVEVLIYVGNEGRNFMELDNDRLDEICVRNVLISRGVLTTSLSNASAYQVPEYPPLNHLETEFSREFSSP